MIETLYTPAEDLKGYCGGYTKYKDMIEFLEAVKKEADKQLGDEWDDYKIVDIGIGWMEDYDDPKQDWGAVVHSYPKEGWTKVWIAYVEEKVR